MPTGLPTYIAAICLLFPVSGLTAQVDLTREEIVEALRSAEARRLQIEITITQQAHYTVGGKQDYSEKTYRLSDASGRYRFWQERRHDDDEGILGSEELVVWDGREKRARGRILDKLNPRRVSLGITEEIPKYHMYDDDIWPFLGIFVDFPISERTPQTRISEAVANPKTPIQISEIIQDGRELVRIELLDPFLTEGKGPEYIYTFDPARDWLVVESMTNAPGREAERYATRYSKHIRITRAEQLGDIWIPMEAEVEHIKRYREADWHGSSLEAFNTKPIIKRGNDGIVREISPLTITVVDINVDPEISDEDFTIHVADLPEGSSIVDSRLGISYKLGENLIYMDGHLNRVGRKITDEITPRELKNLMADAEPLIDPELVKLEADLKPVAPKGLWTNRTAYALGMIGIGVGVLGIYLFWRKQHAA